MSEDYLWDVVRPCNGNADQIHKMNVKLLAHDPNTPARYDREAMKIAKEVFDLETFSLAMLARQEAEAAARKEGE